VFKPTGSVDRIGGLDEPVDSESAPSLVSIVKRAVEGFMRITDEHLAHWRRHGYVVVPDLLTEAELAAIQANVRRYFATDEEYRAAPERYPDVGGWRELPFVGDALNDLATHPELASFAERDLPVVDIEPGETFLTPERRAMTLKQLVDALAAQRRETFDYLRGLSDADLGRKARIPLFKSFMGTDEIPVPMFVGAMFDHHINDHAGQLAKIRKAVGLPPA